ncbi:DUF3073 domain-containing protein [Varibaculum prostatecancerukia]|uniref:DUF3073 domain-containing protein n=1 Tax=Varibaculum prostatecancerukia TaxID=2811781 RepID=UPI0035A62F6B
MDLNGHNARNAVSFYTEHLRKVLGCARRARDYSGGGHAMGRGRQKAKQTKVARKLKYYSPETDYEALQRELQAKQRDEAADDSGDDLEDWRDYIPSATDDDWFK